jgi:hypothetical protein
MLSPEQIALMTWLEQQSEPKSKAQMEEASAPGYTSDRVEEMRTQGLLTRKLDIGMHGDIGAIYVVSDRGKAALLEIEQKRNQQAEEERRYETQRQQTETQIGLSRQQTRLTLIQTVIALVSFIAGLVVEHYVGLLGLLTGLFGG